MNKSKLVLALASVMLMSCADAQNAKEEAQLRKALAERLNGVKIDSVKKSPIAGMYEVAIGSEVRYTDPSGRFLVEGHIIDLQTRTDLTQARIDDLNKIKFDDLPFELALKTVKGNGKRVMAIFED